MVIPEFDPCSGDGVVYEGKSQNTSQCCSSSSQSLTCSSLCQCKEESKTEPAAQQTLDLKPKCFKCKTGTASFTNKQDKVCRDCFKDMFVHKFKSSLRTHLKIWKDDLNLICISGGSYSMAMLNLMWQSLFGNNQNRKMFFRVHILFIEEGSAVYKWSDERR